MVRTALCLGAVISIHISGFSQAAVPAKPLRCDDSLRASFKPDALTTVVLVKAFSKGQPLELTAASSKGAPAAAFSGVSPGQSPRAPNDLCLVKLNVGPGHRGPAGAPSTSPGIGIEVWLPSRANWNGRVHAVGGGGWVGGPAGSLAAIAWIRAGLLAGEEGAVSSYTNTGHEVADGSFAMNPDGTINQALWLDFAGRGIHEQAVKTKALATAYYGKPPRYSYFEGASTGGRQGHKLAQDYPDDYDGIIANLGALHWTRFATGNFYAQLVIQRDLGGVMPTRAQQDLVSNAAIHACDVVGGQHLGYIMDQAACRYDPAQDFEVLCAQDGGKNTTPACVTRLQATAFNKIWYGQTRDGSVPPPALDNGWSATTGGNRLWFGEARGTSLYNAYYSAFSTTGGAGILRAEGPNSLFLDHVALELQNPNIATTNFINATGNGRELWRELSYEQLANAFDRGVALNPLFGHINTDSPDLSVFKARGGKLLVWHGTNDEVIPVQGTVRYYESVIERLGGVANVQSFYRFYVVPGGGHMSPHGTSNPDANPPAVAAGQFYQLLVNWVEKGIEPGRIEIKSPKEPAISQPICPYPLKATYQGGDPRVTASFSCS